MVRLRRQIHRSYCHYGSAFPLFTGDNKRYMVFLCLLACLVQSSPHFPPFFLSQVATHRDDYVDRYVFSVEFSSLSLPHDPIVQSLTQAQQNNLIMSPTLLLLGMPKQPSYLLPTLPPPAALPAPPAQVYSDP